MPDKVVLQVKPMPGLHELLGDSYQDAVIEQCKQIARSMRGKPVLGRKAVKKISWHHVPAKPRVVKKRTIRKYKDGSESVASPQCIRPRFTYRSRAELVEQAGRHKRFLADYRKRRADWLAGDKTSPWPYGTYYMCRRLGAPQANPN